ncbi:unnamed protein product [Linum trigynum]|uniref:Uncharacterized protein n=2 Tax=Linum trigynum TaxID=586398 RepID=A0AAV2EGG2_9ROSI
MAFQDHMSQEMGFQPPPPLSAASAGPSWLNSAVLRRGDGSDRSENDNNNNHHHHGGGGGEDELLDGGGGVGDWERAKCKVTEWRWGTEKTEGRWRRRGSRRRLLRGRICGGGLSLAARTGVGVDAEKGREGRSLILQIGDGRRSRSRIRVLVKR